MVRKRKERKIERPSIVKENGSMNIYDPKQREEMLKDDEITAAESGFMAGRELTEKRKKSWFKNSYHHETNEKSQED